MASADIVRVPSTDQREHQEYNAPRLNLTVADFDILRRLGDGSFSTVILARHKATGSCYAVKIINKHLVLRNKVVDYIRNERTILDRLDHPGIARLHFTFQDADSLYMGLEHCAGGELYEQLQARGAFPLEDARFYAAEVLELLTYLRKAEVIHRDLKPENLLLNEAGHVQLIDFGSAKALFLPPTERRSGNRSTSFVGTAEYVSPEVLSNTGVSYASDLWALGCLIFQLLVGKPPFKAASEYMTFQRVSACDLQFPEGFPPAAQDLVESLLQLEPSQRLGAADLAEVQAHPFFEGIDWQHLRSQPAPQLVPRASSPTADADALALDWELSSLMRAAPVRVEYLSAEHGATAV